MRLRFFDKRPVRFYEALIGNENLKELKNKGDVYFGFGVDAGLGCICDAQVHEVFCDWLNWKIPGTEHHIPIFQSGFGDGVYPVYWGIDEIGAICQMVIQFIDIELAYGEEED